MPSPTLLLYVVVAVVVVLVTASQQLTDDECARIGFAASALRCRACEQLRDTVPDRELYEECRMCCADDDDDEPEMYKRAVLTYNPRGGAGDGVRELLQRLHKDAVERTNSASTASNNDATKVAADMNAQQLYPALEVRPDWNAEDCTLALTADNDETSELRVAEWNKETLFEFLDERLRKSID